MNPSSSPASPSSPATPGSASALSLLLSSSPGVGKIARLPASIRHQLNLRLDNNEPATAILPWLNALPETRQLLRAHFHNAPVTPQNLSEWRQGGFRQWRLSAELLAQTATLQENADALRALADPVVLADNLAALLAVRFAAVLNNWDGQPTDELQAQLRLLRPLTRDVLALQKSLHGAADRRAQIQRQNRADAAAQFQAAKENALAQLKIPKQTRRNDFFFGPAAAAIARVEAAATLEEIQQILASTPPQPPPPPGASDQIQPNPTSATPPAAPPAAPQPNLPHPSSSSATTQFIQPNPTTPPAAATPADIHAAHPNSSRPSAPIKPFQAA